MSRKCVLKAQKLKLTLRVKMNPKILWTKYLFKVFPFLLIPDENTKAANGVFVRGGTNINAYKKLYIQNQKFRIIP